jgi:hypothetical protein
MNMAGMLLRGANRRTGKKAAPLLLGPSQIASGREVRDQRFKWNDRKLYCVEIDINKFGHDDVEWKDLVKKSCRKVLCSWCSGDVVNRVKWGYVNRVKWGFVNRLQWGRCEQGEVGIL